LHIGASLTADDEAKKFYSSVEDILDQADEVDKKLLQVIYLKFLSLRYILIKSLKV
jgi:hypothetical protein